ncbi:MAG: hypothetical protein IJV58_03910 [Oscillospiraceae bacterium]|nr:hypothetical protein [Oscillospiraceae bacterium]MBR1458880.1 hypothetical protein [Oscillospiraceae bacterium]
MKEYRIITVPLDFAYNEEEYREPSSIGKAVLDFFAPTELTAGNLHSEGQLVTDTAERLMQEMNRGGWEVVSAAPFGTDPTEMLLLVTFSRELS